MERELLAKVVVSIKQLVATKYKDEAVQQVMKKLDQIAACYMPGDWIGQPQQSELSEQEYWQRIEQVLSGNHN